MTPPPQRKKSECSFGTCGSGNVWRFNRHICGGAPFSDVSSNNPDSRLVHLILALGGGPVPDETAEIGGGAQGVKTRAASGRNWKSPKNKGPQFHFQLGFTHTRAILRFGGEESIFGNEQLPLFPQATLGNARFPRRPPRQVEKCIRHARVDV